MFDVQRTNITVLTSLQISHRYMAVLTKVWRF